eukprot:3171530-Amphidinium_carterae.1
MQTLIVEGLADDHEMHMIAAAYIGKVTDIERSPHALGLPPRPLPTKPRPPLFPYPLTSCISGTGQNLEDPPKSPKRRSG